MKKHNTTEESENNPILGWCIYCKDPVYEEDDYVKKSNIIYHVECWKQQNGFIEELNFDD